MISLTHTYTHAHTYISLSLTDFPTKASFHRSLGRLATEVRSDRRIKHSAAGSLYPGHTHVQKYIYLLSREANVALNNIYTTICEIKGHIYYILEFHVQLFSLTTYIHVPRLPGSPMQCYQTKVTGAAKEGSVGCSTGRLALWFSVSWFIPWEVPFRWAW